MVRDIRSRVKGLVLVWFWFGSKIMENNFGNSKNCGTEILVIAELATKHLVTTSEEHPEPDLKSVK